MSSDGAIRPYRFGAKNNWRRWMWNEVVKRTNGAEQRLPTLYLAGPEDNDRFVAVDKGFPRDNLIAVDRDRSNYIAVRRAGGPALREDIYDVLEAWPHKRLVASVVMDFCGGFTEDVMRLNAAFARNPFISSVKALNFQRGRDGWSNELRQLLLDAGIVDLLLQSTFPFHNESISRSNKNRAVHFTVWQAHLDWHILLRYEGTWMMAIDALLGRNVSLELSRSLGDDAPRGAYHLAIQWIVLGLSPAFHSYKSGGLVFDSVVYGRSEHVGKSMDDYWEAAKPIIQNADETKFRAARAASINTPCEADVKRRIGAMLAVRSRDANRAQKLYV